MKHGRCSEGNGRCNAMTKQPLKGCFNGDYDDIIIKLWLNCFNLLKDTLESTVKWVAVGFVTILPGLYEEDCHHREAIILTKREFSEIVFINNPLTRSLWIWIVSFVSHLWCFSQLLHSWLQLRSIHQSKCAAAHIFPLLTL